MCMVHCVWVWVLDEGGVINTWNSLPAETVLAPKISTFKPSLDNYWNDIGYGYGQRPIA